MLRFAPLLLVLVPTAGRPDAPGLDDRFDELALIPGSLVLAGTGPLAPAVRSAFVDLAGGGAARIVVLSDRAPSAATVDWADEGAAHQTWLRPEALSELIVPDALEALLTADGVWLDGLSEPLRSEPLLRAVLVGALERGAAIGAAGDLARSLTGRPPVDPLALVPRLHLVFGAEDPGREDTHHHVGRAQPARVVAALPDGTALVVYGGRRVALLGEGDIGFAVYREGGALADEQVLPCRAERLPGDPFEPRLDLLSWIRQARAAERPIFPPATPARPTVAAGALVLQGGGGVTDATWARFIELAGGEEARFVCIPSADELDDDIEPHSYSARELTARGCTNVRIVHAAERRRADRDDRLLATIDAADAVWIDGGRTFRFMDRFGETRAAVSVARVLERGGVVGGSSAGCQVLGQFLVRGNPSTNSAMTDPGYLEGLGLLPGVVLDAHFRERRREPQLAALVQDHPQLLGLGVDAGTALVISGSVAEVTGEGGVVVFDARDGREPPEGGVVLESGARFDLLDDLGAGER